MAERAPSRPLCPSCQHRLSPLALECPVCGLTIARRVLPRPLLFQASALQETPPSPLPRQQAISTPALGRVAPLPLPLPEPPEEDAEDRPILVAPLAPLYSAPSPQVPASLEEESDDHSFWPLVRMELTESLCIFALNGLIALLVSFQTGPSLTRVYGQIWQFLLPLHLAISWAYVMVPIALGGQSLAMSPRGLLLDTTQPERRLAFSVFHLISTLLFPLSFFCMVLTANHQTLAELLTGQEILMRPDPRR